MQTSAEWEEPAAALRHSPRPASIDTVDGDVLPKNLLFYRSAAVSSCKSGPPHVHQLQDLVMARIRHSVDRGRLIKSYNAVDMYFFRGSSFCLSR